MNPLVSVLVLYYRQREYVQPCLDALSRQTYPNIEIFFVDNGSKDGALDDVRSRYPDIQVIGNPCNLYFSKAHNIAIRKCRGEHVMPFNTDVIATQTYVQQMVETMELDPRAGMVSGKLLRADRNLRPLDPPVLDSTGMWFSPELRHFDRGAEEKDQEQYGLIEYIFGPSGAAPLYRRAMLEDIAFQGEYFDEDFVIYREDADLAWRAQLLGWKGIYTPSAVAFHMRAVRPSDSRRKISPEMNMHSVKNRFLMRIKNQTWRNAFRFLLPTLWRDVQVIGYVILHYGLLRMLRGYLHVCWRNGDRL